MDLSKDKIKTTYSSPYTVPQWQQSVYYQTPTQGDERLTSVWLLPRKILSIYEFK